jgi:tetratricopeptide (TPR) repeat protein
MSNGTPDEISPRFKKLEDAMSTYTSKTDKLDGKLDMITWVGTSLGIVIALIGLFGAMDYMKKSDDLAGAIAKAQLAQNDAEKAQTAAEKAKVEAFQAEQSAKKIVIDNIRLVQADDVQRVEDLFSQQESIDSIKDRQDILQEFDMYRSEIDKRNALLDDHKTTYQMLVSAIHDFLEARYIDAMQALEAVDSSERNHYAYNYIKAMTYMRLGQETEAESSFASAGREAAKGKRHLQSKNFEILIKLTKARKAREEAQLLEAQQNYEQIIQEDKFYAPAYTNLACCLATLGRDQYERVTRCLYFPVKLRIRSVDEMVERVKEDVSTPTERFLAEYVKDGLKVASLVSDARWDGEVKAALITSGEGFGLDKDKAPYGE